MTNAVYSFDPSTIDHLNAILIPVLRERVDRLGETESGAYNFYVQRLNRGNLFANYEIEIVKRFIATGIVSGGVHEIGSGLGQLPFLFAANGVEAAGVEIDKRRFAAGAAMVEALAKGDPDAAARVRFLPGAFPLPHAQLDPGNAVVLATNLVFTTSPQTKLTIIRAMQHYRMAVIDADRLFDRYTTQEDRERTFGLMSEAGYPGGEPFLDLGDSGRYFRYAPHGATAASPAGLR